MSTRSQIDIPALQLRTTEILTSLTDFRISRWRLVLPQKSTLIVGGFADVKEARLRGSGWRFLFTSPIAIKQLHLDRCRSTEERIRVMVALARELNVWRDLKHENILPLTGFYVDESMLETAWIVTAWQANGSVSSYIAATNPNEARRIKLLLDTARGVEYLHGLDPPVCYADIKAANTLVDNGGNVLLCDFGLTKVIQEAPSGLTTTAFAYTSLYAAPELVAVPTSTPEATRPTSLRSTTRRTDGLSRLGALEALRTDGLSRPEAGGSETPIKIAHTLYSDVWAWGCLALVIMTDKTPYEATKPPELPADIPLTMAPDFILAILEGCWELVPTSRPSMVSCAQALRTQATRPFSYFTQLPFNRVPSIVKTDLGDWFAIRNPELDFSFEVEATFTHGGEWLLRHRCNFWGEGPLIVTSGGSGGVVEFYDVEKGQNLSPLDTKTASPSSEGTPVNDWVLGCFSSTKGLLFGTLHYGDSGYLFFKVWNLPRRTLRFDLRHPSSYYKDPERSSLTFIHADQIAVTATTQEVRTWSAETGALLQTLDARVIGKISGSWCHPFIVCWCRLLGNVVWNAQTGHTLRIQEGSIGITTFMPNGNGVLTQGEDDDKSVRIWDLRPVLERWKDSTSVQTEIFPPLTLEETDPLELPWRELDANQSTTEPLSLSSDGQIAAFQTSDDSVCLWDLSYGKPVTMLRSREGTSLTVDFEPGSTLSEGNLVMSVHDPEERLTSLRRNQAVKYRRCSQKAPETVGYFS